MSDSDYRPFVPAPGHGNIAGPTPRAHAQARMQNPRAQDLFGTWAQLAAAPFQGVTTDGHVLPGLFSLGPQDAPTPAMVEAVQALLREIRATQLEHSVNLEALQARSQRIERQLEELYARFEQMKQGATYDDLFSELERILANEKPK